MSDSKGKKLSKGIVPKIIIFLAILLLIFSGVLIYATTLMNTNKIYTNIFVNGVDVSNLSIDEANALLSKSFKYGDLTLENESKKWVQNLDKLGFKYNIHQCVVSAYDIGRKGDFLSNAFTVLKLKFGAKENISLKATEDFEKLNEFYTKVTSEVDSSPVNASVSVNAGAITVNPSKNGYKVEVDKLKEEVKTALQKSENKSVNLPIPVIIQEPKIKTEQLSSINGVIASYNTKYSMGDAERAYNVSLSAQKLDNQLLMPGDEISFQHLLGEVSVANGFKAAKIIVNNEYRDGLGGGVCQVSSTLYNALLLGNIDITQRTNHSLPIGYVPIGRDATIAVPGPDLKYKNNNSFPVLIKTYAYNGTMTAQIYGDTTKSKKIDLYSEVTSTIAPNVIYKNDPNLPKGREQVDDYGHTGYTSVTYKIIDGKKTVISRDRYAMKPKIIRTGTGPELTPPPEQKTEQPATANAPQPQQNQQQTQTAPTPKPQPQVVEEPQMPEESFVF